MYTIKFQRHGLPHAHLLIFLHPANKYPNAEDIDKVISDEIPCPIQEPELHQCVKEHMIHGPCVTINNSLPCMKNGKCSIFFPKKFYQTTTISEDGFPYYRRRNNLATIIKNGISLDNRSVVPYNPVLLVKYQAHINVEWCNKSSSIKYLFKYINKGYDRITTTIVPNHDESNINQESVDKIKKYLDCRYISPCEACWRIFSFHIHGRNHVVERLYFHLPGDKDEYSIDDIMGKTTVAKIMFISWMECNKKYQEARCLTYSQIVSKFVYVKKRKMLETQNDGKHYWQTYLGSSKFRRIVLFEENVNSC